MSEPRLVDVTGRMRSPAATPGHWAGCVPPNKGMRFPADPPTVEEIILVMREAGPGPYADRTRGLIAILWRAGLRISEALALTESDLDPKTGSVQRIRLAPMATRTLLLSRNRRRLIRTVRELCRLLLTTGSRGATGPSCRSVTSAIGVTTSAPRCAERAHRAGDRFDLVSASKTAIASATKESRRVVSPAEARAHQRRHRGGTTQQTTGRCGRARRTCRSSGRGDDERARQQRGRRPTSPIRA